MVVEFGFAIFWSGIVSRALRGGVSNGCTHFDSKKVARSSETLLLAGSDGFKSGLRVQLYEAPEYLQSNGDW